MNNIELATIYLPMLDEKYYGMDGHAGLFGTLIAKMQCKIKKYRECVNHAVSRCFKFFRAFCENMDLAGIEPASKNPSHVLLLS